MVDCRGSSLGNQEGAQSIIYYRWLAARSRVNGAKPLQNIQENKRGAS